MDYEFVVTSHDPGDASQSTRQLVRRRASQAAARTRRREARFTRVNQLQMPPWLEADLARASTQSIDPLFIEPNPLAQSITRTLSPSPPRSLLPLRELLEFSKYDMSRTLLSHDELSTILSDPLRIQKVLSLTHEQFFLGLGERNETNQCVNDAVGCLWAYIEQLLLPGLSSASRNKHVKCYVRALNSIRSALDEGSALNSIDVWYATLILILYESLKPCGNSWVLHACGAVHILENLGPRSIINECQKNLLTAQSAMMTTEAIFKNKTCFLSQREWQIALQSTIIQNPTLYSRNEAAVTFWMHAAYIPDIFQDTTNFLLHKGTVNHESVLFRIKAVHENYQNWYSCWQLQLEYAVMEMSESQFCENTRPRIELLCCYLEHFCIIQRLFLCLNPTAGVEIEEGVAESARRLLEIYEQYTKSGQPKYRIGMSVFAARTILATTDRWRLGISGSSTSPTIDPKIFLEWCEILRRSVD